MARDVRATTGIAAVPGSSFSARIASVPSMSGSRMSIRITSGQLARATAMPSAPVPASSVSSPETRRTSRASRMFFSLSSTIRTVSAAIASRDRLEGKREAERAALAGSALDPQPATVQLDQPPRQRQAKARSLRMQARGAPGLAKLLEDDVLILRRDPRPGVGDRDLDAVRRLQGDDVDAASRRRQLDGVREEVEYDLAHLP